MGVSLIFIRLDKADFEKLTSLNEEQLHEKVALMADFDIDKAWDALHFVLTGKRAEVANVPRTKYRGGPPIQERLKALFGLGNHESVAPASGPRMIPSEDAATLERAIDAGFLFPHDLGLGLATYLDDRSVADVAQELSRLNDDELKERFHPDTMNKLKIYPGYWSDTDLENYILPAFIDLRMFYAAAARAGQYVIKYFA